jgi:glycopeptide antibiotics resistance protein
MIFGNLAAFAPMGFFLPALFKKCRKLISYIITIITMTLLVEMLQFFLRAGVCDIDDIILNTAGAVCVWFLIRSKAIQPLFNKITLGSFAQVNT